MIDIGKKPVMSSDGFPVFDASVYQTGRDTPYLQEPGVALVAKTGTSRASYKGFLAGFDPELEFEQYMGDEPAGNATHLSKLAGQLCYMSFGPVRTKNIDAQRYIDGIKEQKHGSVLEHPNFSFLFYGVSRSFTHELVRHRAGFGFSQVSQRYVSGKTLRFVERPEFKNHSLLHEEFKRRIDDAAATYDRTASLLMETMKDQLSSLSKTEARKAVNQAARAVLPNETEAPIVVTGNARSWRHFLEMRGSKFAEPEIRAVSCRVLYILSMVAPEIYSDYQVKELTDGSFVIGTELMKV